MSNGVKKLAQVVVGAVIGFVQGGPVGAVIGAGLAFYAAEQQEKLNSKSPLRDNEPSAQTVRSSKAPARFILGRVATGGVLAWAQEQSGEAADGEWLHMVYVLSEGPISALENIYLGEEEIGSYGEFASYELIVNPTQVNAFLLANCAGWKESQIGRGLSYVRVSFRYSAEKFPSGIPDVRFVVRGRDDIYDPRSGAFGYSANTALHILWYLRARCGVPDDEIVFSTFASAANVCDEAVTNAGGSVSQRYRTACVIGADEQRTGVLQKLEAACAGKLIRVGGRWMLQAGAYYGPFDFEINEDMVVGTITGSTEPSNDAAINTVRGTFIDPSQSWTETDYPEVRIDEWVVEDGGEAAETLTFSYVTDPYQAQRLANIELRRRRGGGTINIPMNLSGYNCRPGRVIRVNLPSLNILGEFIVTNWSMGNQEGCSVSVAQYEPAIFSDAVGQPYNPIGFINLPAGGLGSPTNLAWTQDSSAEVTQGVLSWKAPAGIVKEYVVIVRQGTSAIQSHNVPATSTERAISGLPSGNYTMSVAAVGPMARSGEATIAVNVNGPPIPEACVVQSSIDSITLIPSNTLRGLNGGTYEYFFSSVPSSDPDDALYLGQGLSFTHTGLGFYTNYYYFVRSSNAYGKSAFLYVPASTSNDVGAYLDAIAGKISETELGADLLDRIDLIDGPPTLPGSVNDRLKELNDQVDAVTDQLQEQIDAIGDIVDALEYDDTKTYAAGESVRQGQRLYQASQAVPINTPPPNATYWLDVGQIVKDSNGLAARVTTTETKITSIEGVNTAQGTAITGLQTSLTGKADASALNSLTTRVTSAEGTISSQGTAITGLNNSLTTTNTNVTAAQNAANAANTLAGGKGKVIVQAGAPAVADQLAQNLWIDITGGANTPKRWTGSTWAAVTDKVATDAAAAAASALTQVATKAEAATVQALSNTVTQQGDTITAQGSALTSISATVGGIGGNGANLVPSVYSWPATSTLPILVNSAAVSTVAAAVAEAMSGFGYASTVADTNTGRYAILAPANNAANWNLSLEVGSYILSFYASSSAATQKVSAGVWSGTARLGSQVTLSTVRTRYSFVFSVVTAGKAAPIIYLSQAGISGLTMTYDSVMIERQIGTNTAPSAFVAGPTAATLAAQAAATSALDARVTQTETGLTTQAGQITALNTGLAGKADNSALQSLASTVTQQGDTLTSQGTAVTQLQSTVGSIGGAGSNLLPDTYSWLASETLPATVFNTLSRIGLAVAAASSGFGVKMTLGSSLTSQFLMLSPTNNVAGWNIDMEAGSYLVSMYVQASVAGAMRVSMYNGTHRYSSNVAYSTTRQRLVFVCTASAFARAAITIYPNMSGLPAGTEITIDSVMIEKQIGTSTVPSPFVAGSSAMTSFGQATAIGSLDVRVTDTEGKISAQATKLDGIYVQVNPALAGDTTGFAGSSESFVGVWSEQSARIEDGLVIGSRVDTVEVVSNQGLELAQQSSAIVQQVSQAQIDLEGKASAMWSVKLQVNSLGQYVAAGIGLGIENGPAGLQSTFLVSADTFAVVNGINGTLSSPFAVTGGQVFIRSAFIQDGSITMLKIGDALQSDNYVAGTTGWRLTKSGVFEINGNVPGAGRMTMTNSALKVLDANGVKRVQLGDLNA